MSNTPNQINPGSSPMRRMLRKANASLNGPQAPDVSPDAGSSSLAVNPNKAARQAAKDDILFIRGGEIGRLGSLSVHAELEGLGATTPTIKDARPDWARPTPRQQSDPAPSEAPVIVQG